MRTQESEGDAEAKVKEGRGRGGGAKNPQVGKGGVVRQLSLHPFERREIATSENSRTTSRKQEPQQTELLATTKIGFSHDLKIKHETNTPGMSVVVLRPICSLVYDLKGGRTETLTRDDFGTRKMEAKSMEA